MRAYECVKCGARYPVEYVNDWGRHAASDGLGTRPVCGALVEARVPPTATGEKPRELCRGDLALTEIKAAEAGTVVPVRPIKP